MHFLGGEYEKKQNFDNFSFLTLYFVVCFRCL